MQLVTLYVTVNITPMHNSPPSIPTNDDVSPAEEATLPGRIQSPTSEHLLPLSHHQPVETEITMPHRLGEVSLTSTKDPLSVLDQADEAMKRIGRSNTCEMAVRRIKWVMDTLGPIAEVRVIPF
jgi:hypothetical protein